MSMLTLRFDISTITEHIRTFPVITGEQRAKFIADWKKSPVIIGYTSSGVTMDELVVAALRVSNASGLEEVKLVIRQSNKKF